MSEIAKKALEAADLEDRACRQRLATKVLRLTEWQRWLIKITWLVLLVPVLALIGAIIFAERYFAPSIIVLVGSFLVIATWWWAKRYLKTRLVGLRQSIKILPKINSASTPAAERRNAATLSAQAHPPGWRPPPPDTHGEIAKARIEAHQT